MTKQFETARDVCEYTLDVTGEALMSGNFELFATCFAYPLELQTFIGQRTIRNEDELHEVFNNVRSHYTNTGVTEISRRCVEAAFKDDTTVETVHETRLLSGARITQAPFPVFARVVYDGASWRVVHTSYAIPDRPAHDIALLGRDIVNQRQTEITE